ncbi:MAG TPA: dihydropteroate synthase [Chryseosolibacter sp.]|nr:dihydropteroate synthase [Chryseosolibacter sp.]
MGILNVTPDSFYDGGKYLNEKSPLEQTEKMLSEGAAIIDVGGYSSRPGADDISEEEELARVLPVVTGIRKNFPDAIISIDTFRSTIVREAAGAGASMVNDISAGLIDSEMIATVAALKLPYVMMHMKGTPQTMNTLAHYDNLIGEIVDFFTERIQVCQQAGIKDIVIDPGFGFAKTREQNFQLLNSLGYLTVFGRPVLAGVSRKSMIWKTLGQKPEEALNGTTVLNTISLLNGASILRVHDVKEARETITLIEALRQNSIAQP